MWNLQGFTVVQISEAFPSPRWHRPVSPRGPLSWCKAGVEEPGAAAAGVVQGIVSQHFSHLQHFYTVFPQSNSQTQGPPASGSQMRDYRCVPPRLAYSRRMHSTLMMTDYGVQTMTVYYWTQFMSCSSVEPVAQRACTSANTNTWVNALHNNIQAATVLLELSSCITILWDHCQHYIQSTAAQNIIVWHTPICISMPS